MATKKITLSELRNLVKQMINEAQEEDESLVSKKENDLRTDDFTKLLREKKYSELVKLFNTIKSKSALQFFLDDLEDSLESTKGRGGLPIPFDRDKFFKEFYYELYNMRNSNPYLFDRLLVILLDNVSSYTKYMNPLTEEFKQIVTLFQLSSNPKKIYPYLPNHHEVLKYMLKTEGEGDFKENLISRAKNPKEIVSIISDDNSIMIWIEDSLYSEDLMDRLKKFGLKVDFKKIAKQNLSSEDFINKAKREDFEYFCRLYGNDINSLIKILLSNRAFISTIKKGDSRKFLLTLHQIGAGEIIKMLPNSFLENLDYDLSRHIGEYEHAIESQAIRDAERRVGA